MAAWTRPINLRHMENEGNIIGIAAVMIYFGLCCIKFRHKNGLYQMDAIDPKTNRVLSFWYDAPNEQVKRSIIESRKAFGVIV